MDLTDAIPSGNDEQDDLLDDDFERLVSSIMTPIAGGGGDDITFEVNEEMMMRNTHTERCMCSYIYIPVCLHMSDGALIRG